MRSRLTNDQIDRLVDALRQQGAPVVDRLAPGLSDREMDELTAPLDIRLPEEARTWWGHCNGAHSQPGDGAHSVALSPAWWWAPLEAVVSLCQELRAMSDPDTWLASWLPIVVGDGELIIDTSVARGQLTPVHVIDFEGDDDDFGVRHVPTLPSLAALVDTWTAAVSASAVRFMPEVGYFDIDFDVVDALGVPDGLL